MPLRSGITKAESGVNSEIFCTWAPKLSKQTLQALQPPLLHPRQTCGYQTPLNIELRGYYYMRDCEPFKNYIVEGAVGVVTFIWVEFYVLCVLGVFGCLDSSAQ